MIMADETQVPMATNGPDAGSNTPHPPAPAESFDIEMNPIAPSATPAVPSAEVSIPKPSAPTTSGALSASTSEPRGDETEFERIQRLKLQTDDAPHSGEISNDIASILHSVKLPERRDFKGTADTRPPSATIAVPNIDEALKQSVPQAPSEPEARPTVVASHTLKDDLQDIVRRKKISLVKAAALEADKKRPDPIMPLETVGERGRKHRTAAIVFVSILLIFLGGGALYGVTVVENKHPSTTSATYPSLIFAEQTVTVPIDNTSPAILKAALAHALTQNLGPVGSITQIIPTISATSADSISTTGPATLSEFFAALGISPPSQLTQGLGDSFFFGAHTVDVNAPVLVIPVTNYDLAFAGMLAWEPQMNTDLSPIFTSVPTLTTGANGLPTARTFADAVMRNYDVRELKDDSGTIVLYYSFPTPDLLVIAQSPNTFAEVLSRLQAHGNL